MIEESSHAVHEAEGHAGGIAEIIMHHVTDQKWPLNLFGMDIPFSKHILMMWIACIVIIVISQLALREKGLIPRGIRNLIEVFILFIRDEIVYANFGREDGKKYVPFFLTIFFFILFCNLIGLIPFAATATGNINVTATLAVITFIMIQASGIQKFGLVRYVKNIVPHGVPLWVVPILFPVELLGLVTKAFALAIRLFANMIAGHIVITSLLSLIILFKLPPFILFALAISLLEVLIALIQAYIFTFLSAIFISMARHAH